MYPVRSFTGVIPQRPPGGFRLAPARRSPELCHQRRHDPRLRIGEVVLILALRFILIRCAAFGRRFLPRSGLHCPFGVPEFPSDGSRGAPVLPAVRRPACPCHGGYGSPSIRSSGFLPKSRPSPVCRVTRRATALERRLSPGTPRAYLRRLLSRQSCYCFAALDRPDRLETAFFGNRGTT